MTEPETFTEAVEYLDKKGQNIEALYFSIQYYGFGEHFTTWARQDGFIDFGIDDGTVISWPRMKEIIIETAQHLYEANNPNI